MDFTGMVATLGSCCWFAINYLVNTYFAWRIIKMRTHNGQRYLWTNEVAPSTRFPHSFVNHKTCSNC